MSKDDLDFQRRMAWQRVKFELGTISELVRASDPGYVWKQNRVDDLFKKFVSDAEAESCVGVKP